MPLCQFFILKCISYTFIDSYKGRIKELLKEKCRNMGKIVTVKNFITN